MNVNISELFKCLELFAAKMKPHRHIALNIEAEMKKLIQINANVIKDRSLNSSHWAYFLIFWGLSGV